MILADVLAVVGLRHGDSGLKKSKEKALQSFSILYNDRTQIGDCKMLFYVWFGSLHHAMLWADTCDYPVKVGKQYGAYYVGF